MMRKKPDAFLPLRSNWFHILLSLVDGEQHGYGIMQDVLDRCTDRSSASSRKGSSSNPATVPRPSWTMRGGAITS